MLCKPAASFTLLESMKIWGNIQVIIYRLQQDFLLDDDNSNGVQLGQVNIYFIYILKTGRLATSAVYYTSPQIFLITFSRSLLTNFGVFN